MQLFNNFLTSLDRPAYVLEEERLRKNLYLIKSIADSAGIEIILAFKSYALWKTFPIFREYISATTASSLSEARLAYEEFKAPAHTYSPAYTDYEIDDIARCSSHLTFNSISQYMRYAERATAINPELSLGIRINPEYSEVETLLYNPCAPGTRFGVNAEKMKDFIGKFADTNRKQNREIGFHCHCHCESGSDVFERSLKHIEEKFSEFFPHIQWINFGGGHLMTRNDYDTERLIRLMKDFRNRYPWLKVILEPGSAFAWQTGTLVSQVVDIVEDHGIRTAILNVSFTCHMPDCLEMPYFPTVRGAKHIDVEDYKLPLGQNNDADDNRKHIYRLGGNSCLSGDWMEAWMFDHELKVGETIIFEDMLHYTTVKTNTFNGITHPAIMLLNTEGALQTLREFTYEDYRDRMD